MSLIIAARFETFDAAERAARALMDAGIAQDALHTFFVNPPGAHDRYPGGGDRAADPGTRGAPSSAVGVAAGLGVLGAIIGAGIGYAVADSMLPIIGGAGVGAYIGSLAGGVSGMGRPRPKRSAEEARDAKANEGRTSGVLLAVHSSPEQQQKIAGILRNAGGEEIERAQGRWRDGKWEDFDPLISPQVEKNF